MPIQKITPFLCFDTEAEQAAQFYTSVFKNSKIEMVTRYGDSGPRPKGTAMTVSFEIEGLKFTALNAGPMFKFSEAISFVVTCENQQEVDELWSKLTSGGGKELACGWLTDRFGVSWQIVPKRFLEMISDPDPARKDRAMKAMMQMRKFDIPALEAAFQQE